MGSASLRYCPNHLIVRAAASNATARLFPADAVRCALRPQPLPAQLWIQARECPGGLRTRRVRSCILFCQPLSSCNSKSSTYLLPGFDQPVWLTQDAAGHEVLEGCMCMPERMLGDRLHASQKRLQRLPQLSSLFTTSSALPRGGRTQVSHKIGNSIINFMSYGRNDRSPRWQWHARPFFIKGPEVLSEPPPRLTINTSSWDARHLRRQSLHDVRHGLFALTCAG